MLTELNRAHTAESGNGDGKLGCSCAEPDNGEAQYIIIIKFKKGQLESLLSGMSCSEQALVIGLLLKLLPAKAPQKDHDLILACFLPMRPKFQVLNGNYYDIHHNNKVGG